MSGAAPVDIPEHVTARWRSLREDTAKIADTVQSWKTGDGYEDIAGFCKSVPIEDIEKNNFVLTPGRYVGAIDSGLTELNFSNKILDLLNNLAEIQKESKSLEQTLNKNLLFLRKPDK